MFPLVCISISLIHCDKPMVGAIDAPFAHSLFAAARLAQRTTALLQPPPALPENAPRGCVASYPWGMTDVTCRREISTGNPRGFLNMAAEVGGRGGKGDGSRFTQRCGTRSRLHRYRHIRYMVGWRLL